MECGNKLTLKYEENEGMVPYCELCQAYRYPMFNDAASSITLNKSLDQVLLIKQYGRNANILVAGYLSQGETPIEALIREIKEEVSLKVVAYAYNDSCYYAKSNSLLHNFLTIVDDTNFTLKIDEVDAAAWFPIDKAREAILANSLASQFLNQALDKLEKQRIIFENSNK